MASPQRKLRVVVLYNTKDKAPPPNRSGADDYLAEFDSWETVQGYIDSVRALGHEVIPLHGDTNLPAEFARMKAEGKPVDIVWNSCEGYRG